MLTAEQIANLEGWITELRSGKRKQTQGALQRQETNGVKSFCCLGLYADTQNVKWEFIEYESKNSWNGFYQFKDDQARPMAGRLSKEMFETSTGMKEEQQSRFIELNDKERFTFNQIADEVQKFLDQNR